MIVEFLFSNIYLYVLPIFNTSSKHAIFLMYLKQTTRPRLEASLAAVCACAWYVLFVPFDLLFAPLQICDQVWFYHRSGNSSWFAYFYCSLSSSMSEYPLFSSFKLDRQAGVSWRQLQIRYKILHRHRVAAIAVVIPEACKIGKILYVHLYRGEWYRKVTS